MGSIGKDDVLNRFGYHPGTELTAPKHEQVREAFIMVATFLDELLPHSRSKSTAFSKLEEAAMWSNKAIAELAPVVEPTPPPKATSTLF